MPPQRRGQIKQREGGPDGPDQRTAPAHDHPDDRQGGVIQAEHIRRDPPHPVAEQHPPDGRDTCADGENPQLVKARVIAQQFGPQLVLADRHADAAEFGIHQPSGEQIAQDQRRHSDIEHVFGKQKCPAVPWQVDRWR